jgi:hypothetical protein
MAIACSIQRDSSNQGIFTRIVKENRFSRLQPCGEWVKGDGYQIHKMVLQVNSEERRDCGRCNNLFIGRLCKDALSGIDLLRAGKIMKWGCSTHFLWIIPGNPYGFLDLFLHALF